MHSQRYSLYLNIRSYLINRRPLEPRGKETLGGELPNRPEGTGDDRIHLIRDLIHVVLVFWPLRSHPEQAGHFWTAGQDQQCERRDDEECP